MKKKIEKFKEWDLVRCIDASDFYLLESNTVYIIDFQRSDDMVYLKHGFNYTSGEANGWLPKRFKHVNKKDMTEKEKTLYINCKLGCKSEI